MISDEVAEQMLAMRIDGFSEKKIAQRFDTTPSEVRFAINAALPKMDAQARVLAYSVEVLRLSEEVHRTYAQASRNGDLAATNAVLRASDQRSSLIGLNSPTRLTFELVSDISAPPLNTTEKIRAPLDGLAVQQQLPAPEKVE